MSQEISIADIDRLLAFLPAFEEADRRFGRDWDTAGGPPGGNGNGGNDKNAGKPRYEKDIVEFFSIADAETGQVLYSSTER